MTTPEPLTKETILDIVRDWPVADRLALLQAVLRTLQEGVASPVQREPTLQRALGLAATAKPPPDDATVEQWLEERRQEKYG